MPASISRCGNSRSRPASADPIALSSNVPGNWKPCSGLSDLISMGAIMGAGIGEPKVVERQGGVGCPRIRDGEIHRWTWRHCCGAYCSARSGWALIYGKRQGAPVPLLCGIGLMVLPYFVSNSWVMVLVGAALMGIPYFIRV